MCFYDEYSAANPMNLVISELSFGPDAFAEMKTNLTTFTEMVPNYFLLLANRNLNRRLRNIVLSITCLDDMVLENGHFLVVRTKPNEDPNLVSNLINVTTTKFMPKVNPDNLLDLEDEHAMLAILIYGELDMELFHLSGKQVLLPLDKELLKKFDSLIEDAIVLGGQKSPSGPRQLMKMYLK